MMKRFLLGVLAVLLAVMLLIVFFPASWAWSLARDRVHEVRLESVHGSVWSGRAEGVAYAGMPLGTVRWTLSRAMLLGRPDLHLDVDGDLLRGHGRLLRQGDALTGEDMHFTVDAARVPVSVHGLQPRGRVRFDIQRVDIHGDWPRRLRGTVTWSEAALTEDARRVPLGELRAELHERAGSILEAQLSDGGGPLALSGTVQASTLGWRLDADLSARNDDPGLRHVLDALGKPDAAGVLHLRRHGGLMMGERP
jgi:general secretion pathway protein N